MPKIDIDGKEIDAPASATILNAAGQAGISIPTLCHIEGIPPATSCMLCVVKDLKSGRLVPSCGTPVEDGMRIATDCAEVRQARHEILNLLLSEHVGDCTAPCTLICPAHLDTPLMLRKIADGDLAAAAWIARRDLTLPITLGYICEAPCEKGCRRGQLDKSITICNLHRHVAEAFPHIKHTSSKSSKTTAVIGSGPAGLAAAWNLRLRGHRCAVFDDGEIPGGMLREFGEKTLPRNVIDAEIGLIQQLGVEFFLNQIVTADELAERFDAVIITDTPIAENRKECEKIFNAKSHRQPIIAIGHGKSAAMRADVFLRNLPQQEEKPRFNSRIRNLRHTELEELTKNCPVPDLCEASIEIEAARCLHCDCRKSENCHLREYAQEYDARQNEFLAGERKHIEIIGDSGQVVYEPGKCIKCGICVRITTRAGEEFGMTFTNRGFDTKVEVPFGMELSTGMRKTAEECVNSCPTGALALRDKRV